MKKAVFSVLITLFLLWNYGGIFAQGAGEGKRINRKEEQANRPRKKVRGSQAGTRERGARAKRKRTREQKQLEMQKAEGLKSRGSRRKGKGLGQQLESVRKQIVQEQAKHFRRLARLKRIRELAMEDEATDIVKRVDNLLGKEQRRYDHKQRLLKLHERMLKRGKNRKVRGPYDKTLRKEGEKDIKKRLYERKYKDRGKRSVKKTEP